ncbi:DUF2953 domain-containing protein [Lottiidibacillus patelloidae]|nr:DUF2953 domain-containing protein [Lottiidibacillus patelloidae]
MPWYLWIASALIIFILIIILTKLNISIYYLHEQDNDHLGITMKAWYGLLSYNVNIPLMKVEENSPSLVFKKEKTERNSDKEKEEKDIKLTPTELLNKLKEAKEFLQKVIGFNKIIKKFLKHVELKKFQWDSHLGTGDASQTAIAVGLLWGVKGSIYGLLSNLLKVQTKPEVSIYPLFQMKTSQTRLQCMISFRIGHAIFAAIRVVKYWKGGKTSWNNIQLKV